MNSELPGGARLVAVRALERPFDKFPLEVSNGFIKKNATFYHLSDECFQLVFHGRTLRTKAPRMALGKMPRTQSSVRPVRRS
jgi:hypothetical protein